jgi:L-ascorbate metabolism protein UlaG (beta-lactamase superfamily)
MKIKWLGHASFLLESEAGLRILTDPYAPGMYGLDYGPITENADIVTVSHEHGDHNNVAAVQGSPLVVRGIGRHEIKDTTFEGIATYHDAASGSQRGPNTVFCFSLDGIRVCHLGDLGHELGDEVAAAVRDIDVLLVPVGGNFTIDADTASRIVDQVKPKVVIPMHFRNQRCPNFPVAGVEDFLQGRSNVRMVSGSELELRDDQLPMGEVIVLKPAL